MVRPVVGMMVFLMLELAAASPAPAADVLSAYQAVASTEVDSTYIAPGSHPVSYSDANYALEATESHMIPGSSFIAQTDAWNNTVTITTNSLGLPGGGTGEGEASADLIYFYDVTGANGPVPVDISYYLTASRTAPTVASSSSNATAAIVFYRNYDRGGLVYDAEFAAQVGGLFEGSNFSDTVAATYATEFVPGETYGRVDLQASGFSSSGSGASSSYALADPHITIDPAFLAVHPGVSLEISGGVGNSSPASSAVPEPASWLMMVAGIGLVGHAIRRRQTGPQGENYPAARP